VVDRTLFDYLMGGDCQCCGFRHFFNPEGLAGLIKEVTDLETDAAKAELTAAERSPWPPEMRDEVWADRVRLRHKMKKEMNGYKDFWTVDGADESSSNRKEEVTAWCRDTLGVDGLARIFQIPRSEISQTVHDHYGIHGAFGTVLRTVMEQVANFKVSRGLPVAVPWQRVNKLVTHPSIRRSPKEYGL